MFGEQKDLFAANTWPLTSSSKTLLGSKGVLLFRRNGTYEDPGRGFLEIYIPIATLFNRSRS